MPASAFRGTSRSPAPSASDAAGAVDLSFFQTAREVVETLQARIADSAVFVGYLDYPEERFWIVDASGDTSFGLTPGLNLGIEQSFCFSMASGRAPQLSNDAANDPVYGQLPAQADLGIGSYVGVPLEMADGSRMGSLCAVAHHTYAFRMASRDLLLRSAPVLSAAVPTIEGELAADVLRGTLLVEASRSTLGRLGQHELRQPG